jgi:hypothetical protein
MKELLDTPVQYTIQVISCSCFNHQCSKRVVRIEIPYIFRYLVWNWLKCLQLCLVMRSPIFFNVSMLNSVKFARKRTKSWKFINNSANQPRNASAWFTTKFCLQNFNKISYKDYRPTITPCVRVGTLDGLNRLIQIRMWTN